MAILIPDVPKDCTYSERLVYERLGRELPDDWVVLHSLGLPGHETKIWGEADIVVLSTKGIFAIEVKGGSVRCIDGVWHFGQPGAKEYTKKEDPWSQAQGAMSAIRKKLVEADPQFGDILTGFGVVMPMTTFTTTSAEIEPAVLLDRRDFIENLGWYIAKLEGHWSATYKQKHGRNYRTPTTDQIRRARKILRPNIETTFSIGGYLTAVEARLLQLTNKQIRASRRMAANPRTIVRGRAGTGKTVIAVERARQLSQGGQKVLYLCFNQLLASHVRNGLAADEKAKNIDVRHVHALYREVIEKAGLSGKLNALSSESPEFYAKTFPELFIEAVLETSPEGWDSLIVDEAQDILTSENLDAFDIILKSGLSRGQWHLFLDPQQNIYSADIQEAALNRLADIYPAFDDLVENCRNTRQVATQASIISGIDLALHGAPDGQDCANVYFTSKADFETKLNELVADLIQHDVRAADIAILSTRKRENSLIAEMTTVAGCPVSTASATVGTPKGAILFSTMHAFKGLERPIIITIDMAEIGEQQWSMLHYAGLSRATTLLRVFLPKKAEAAYAQQANLFARRLQLHRVAGAREACAHRHVDAAHTSAISQFRNCTSHRCRYLIEALGR